MQCNKYAKSFKSLSFALT